MACHLHSAQLLSGSLALFSFGLVGSLHCLGMCGPLSSLVTQDAKPRQALALYHLGRISAYSGLGAVLAVLGSPLQAALPWPWLPLLWSIPLLLFALRPVKAPAWMAAWHRKAWTRTLAWPAPRRALALGLLTPLLPCGLLYAAAASALAAPSPWSAAGWMAAFALGSAPGLFLGQTGMLWLARARGGAWPGRLQRVSAALTAAVILYLSRPS
jgi:sulfite exporter TauE/SafE